MHCYFKVLLISVLSVSTLVGCGGGSPYKNEASTPVTPPSDGGGGGGGGDDGGGDGGGDGGTDTPASGISYLPLNVLEVNRLYSQFEEDNLFRTQLWLDPFGVNAMVNAYLINPIDVATFESVSTATVDDYKVTVDGQDIDPSESYPVLQKVIGSETFLRSALVFDLSDSVSGANMTALINEAKAYLTRVRAHPNRAIRNQQFVVWAFADGVVEVTSGFTSDATALNAALDRVLEMYTARSFDPDAVVPETFGGVSNLHRAVIQAIGRYESEDGDYNFGADGDNDLVDFGSYDAMFLSHLVIFSSGPDTFLEFSREEMTGAIESQAFLKYDTAASADSGTMVSQKKPVFYYVLGGNTAGVNYAPLSAAAEATVPLPLVSGQYEFEQDLIARQLEAIQDRVDLSNQYVYRFAFIPRIGAHTTVFTSQASGYNYSLTSDYSEEETATFASIGTPEETFVSLVEITGPNGEFIAGRDIRLAQARTFKVVTRWTERTYDADDYEWSIVGGTGTVNSDGSYTVTSVIDPDGAELTVTNVTRNAEDAPLMLAKDHTSTILVTN